MSDMVEELNLGNETKMGGGDGSANMRPAGVGRPDFQAFNLHASVSSGAAATTQVGDCLVSPSIDPTRSP